MGRRARQVLLAGFALGATGAALPFHAAAADRPALLRCAFQARDAQPQASCDIGPAADLGRVQHVTWRKESRTGTIDATFTPFSPTGKAAALFVVDRGDRLRAKMVAAATADLVRLADSARGAAQGMRAGVAGLGERFDVTAALGASREDIVRAANALKVDGVVGDTAGGARAAIALLAGAPEERRVLVIGSDGKAEDAAYGSDELIRLAQDGRIRVIAAVYRDGNDAPGLIGLRRLAEETGGILLETAPAARLDDAAVTRFGQFLRSGGTASFPLDERDPRGRYVVGVELEGGARLSGTFYADFDAPAGLRASLDAPAAATRGGEIAADAPGLAESSGLDRALDLGRRFLAANPRVLQAVAIGLLTLGAIAWIARFLRRRSIRAYIQLEDEVGTQIPVRTDGIRLGRHSDNDIRFAARSVHRYHAVLFRDPESARYVITDVSRDQARSNGVVVNSEIVKRAELAHGDLVELGEVRFRFLYAGRSAA